MCCDNIFVFNHVFQPYFLPLFLPELRHNFAMLQYFKRVRDAKEYADDLDRIVKELNKHPPPPATIPARKRAVGRQKLKRSATEVLTDAADAEQLLHDINTEEAERKKHRGEYSQRWFDSGFMFLRIVQANSN
jgi:hypothetical protein